MAPSRAVLRNATITFAALRTSSRTSTSPVTRQLHHLSIARPIANTRTTLSTLYTRRFNSSEAATAAAAAPESAAVEAPDYLDEKELHIFQKLNAELEPTKLEVQDVSGGCGSMYALDIVSSKFKGLSVIKQHRLVNAVLKDEIKGWHGVQLKTKAP
ncbi:bola-like protein [Aureobasidium pullulans]|uniref:Bola-like protein n=1 Tax=Aureobasidium pullulans TaxID=5580 RepID=A0A4S8T5J5_AURPU|nr:bola-like protein [Aureobasidium pullulans]THW55213.1 bola-like protein [Aureobasidium pullulans]THY42861.1 bola-like protein [Aureobasidium pullulans]THZ59979.1 bola-like protein [Aureobasidium pullulans]THZ95203.1 bola-like protein [Aureobasidium pullulans]